MNKRKFDIFFFVKTDFIDSEEYTKINYGALENRKESHKFMAKGFSSSVAIFIFIVLSYYMYGWVTNLMKGEEQTAIHKVRITNVSELAPPPSLREQLDNFQLAISPKAPGIGEIKKVKDEEAPRQKTIATQDLLKMANEKHATEGDDTTGLSAAPIIDISVSTGSHGEDPPDFIAVEKEPDFSVQVQPLYPESAKQSGIQGKVILRALVGADGKAEKVQLIKSSGSKALDDSAIQSLYSSTYTPAIQNGKPVRVWFSVPIIFKIQ